MIILACFFIYIKFNYNSVDILSNITLFFYLIHIKVSITTSTKIKRCNKCLIKTIIFIYIEKNILFKNSFQSTHFKKFLIIQNIIYFFIFYLILVSSSNSFLCFSDKKALYFFTLLGFSYKILI